ncbi:Aconitase domain-containing protein [Cladophialophora immunda]|nr:Aconitase domain-containing protein [Cladophialophora immunda]
MDHTNRRPMTACQKILVHHALGLETPYVEPGTVIRVAPDWFLASEVAWFGMNKNYERMGRPGIRRRDRFWLAGDHVVDPRVNHRAYEKSLIEACDQIAKEMDLGDNYAGHNTTIMHTEYYRSRCQPGMLVIGADSHTSSAGALGSLAIGVGATDMILQLVTGETYLEVPEIVRINFINKPPLGTSGKDVILGVMRKLRRNTVAAGRLVEYTGEGLQYLSCDARFAIANMTTEFGGIGACIVPDGVTMQYIQRRRDPRHKSDSLYFRPDDDAQYAETFDVDLSELEHFIALYPSPDNVVPVSEAEQQLQHLQGVFIGACTTTEEELILAALVLKEAMSQGRKPVAPGLRRVTPGSNSIINRLKELNLLEVYEQAGFEIGAPGCSYCVGMGVDKAGKGEVWLSSQNRNYRDRMGPGSIANITSAATVAVSSFSMSLQSPTDILGKINMAEFDDMRRYGAQEPRASPQYVEPELLAAGPTKGDTDLASTEEKPPPSLPESIRGRVQRFGDNVDTDSIIPTDKCHSHLTQEEVARAGASIVVAEKSFGCGSSREQAPKALMWSGIQAVIAKSYAFIYQRNQVNNGLMGIKLLDDEFYRLAQEGEEVMIDVHNRQIHCQGRTWDFRLDRIQEQLLAEGGLISTYERYGPSLFSKLQSLDQKAGKAAQNAADADLVEESSKATSLEW